MYRYRRHKISIHSPPGIDTCQPPSNSHHMEGVPVKYQFDFIQLLSTHGDQDGELAVKIPTDDRAVQEGANHLNQLEEPGQIRRKMTQTHHSY